MDAKPSKDIWSLGCVFSEAVYWSVFGPNGHRQYQDTRRTTTVPALEVSGYSGCFHDGRSIHATVREFHRTAIQGRRMNIDDIVNNIVLIVEEMLESKHARPTALEVHRRLTAALELVRAPASTLSSKRYPPSAQTSADGIGTRLSPPIPPDENALHLHLGSPPRSFTNIALNPQRGVDMIPSAQPWTSHPSRHGHTWPNNSIASSGNRRAIDTDIAQDRHSSPLSSGYDHSPITDFLDDKIVETLGGQSGGFTMEPHDTHRPLSASVYPGNSLSSPEDQTPLPTATVTDVLNWINKKNFNPSLPFKDQDWLKGLHGRDQVSE
jgi:hypothetical protein